MPIWQHYLQPTSLAEALQALQAAPGRAKIIAGGSDLLIDLQQGRHPPVETLVDVTGIPELRALRVEDDHVFLGAAVTHFEIMSSPLLQQHARVLVEAAGLIGGPQVRNLATIGGNVAHGLPAGDGTIALLALDAQAQIAGPQGVRWLPLEGLFLGPGRTIFSAGHDLLLGFRLPLLGPGESSAFWRVMRPQGVAIAILNMGAWLRVNESTGCVEDIRLAAGPAGPTPFRARRTEAVLRGRPLERLLDAETIALAAEEFLAEARLRASAHRSSAEYRRHLAPVILRQVLENACARLAPATGAAPPNTLMVS
jgi:CO/xanthine dehydrogenase FAD-binding subunit